VLQDDSHGDDQTDSAKAVATVLNINVCTCAIYVYIYNPAGALTVYNNKTRAAEIHIYIYIYTDERTLIKPGRGTNRSDKPPVRVGTRSARAIIIII